MKRFSPFSWSLAFFLLAVPAQAAITPTGNVTPSDPVEWEEAKFFSAYVGQTSDGSVSIVGGSVALTSGCYLGYDPDVTGTATVSDSGSIWESGTLYLGYNGIGELNIVNAGTVNNYFTASFLGYVSGAEGVANISGSGSIWECHEMYLGYDGTGELHISEGGVVEHDFLDDGYLGYNATATGIATVSGNGSVWNLGYSNLFLGHSGTGRLDVTDGGAVMARDIYLGLDLGATGTATISGNGSEWTASHYLYVGYSGTGELNLSDEATASSSYGYLGYNSGSVGRVGVSGNGTTWTNFNTSNVFHMIPTSNLQVGCAGTGELTITDAGQVRSEGGDIGYLPGANGTVTVSGENSTWAANYEMRRFAVNLFGEKTRVDHFWVGHEGTGHLDVTDGGTVRSCGGYIGHSAGSNGTVNVSGTQTVWEAVAVPLDEEDEPVVNCIAGNLYVGYEGQGELHISNGAVVNSNGASVGDAPGSNGTVTVTSSGSAWNVAGDLHVGRQGIGSLDITDGGIVQVEGETCLGAETGGNGIIHFDNGTLQTGGLRTEISCLTGTGTIHTHGVVIDANLQFETPGNATETISLAGLTGQNVTIDLDQNATGDLGVGYRGTGTLGIENGATIASNNGYLGYDAGSTGTATVAGSGSSWTNAGDLHVGYHGTGYLEIVNNGAVDVSGQTWVGRYTTTGTIYFNNGTLTTGGLHATPADLDGTGTIYTNGLVSDIDLCFNDADNLVQTLWLNTFFGQNIAIHLTPNASGDLGVGLAGQATMTIQNGAKVSGKNGYLGQNSGSIGVATVTGGGAQWDNWGDLHVGYQGSGEITIADGATLNSHSSYLGFATGSHGKVVVAGTDSKWSDEFTINGGIVITIEESHDLYVGYQGVGELEILDGGTVENGSGYIGYAAGSAGTVTVSGEGATWTNNNNDSVMVLSDTILHVGYKGTGELNIIDGGTVNNGPGYIGHAAGSTGMVTVSGEGSTWCTADMNLHSTNLYVGFNGTGELNITDGGTVISLMSTIGFHENSTGTVTVSGTGSLWKSNDLLYVGQDGVGILNIADGGLVQLDGILSASLSCGPNGFINLSTGGMLAITGEADESINAFLELVEGTDAIRWWDDESGDWAMITTAVEGVDYTLEYCTGGDLDGYTLLTVGHVPEPSSLILLLTALLAAGSVLALKKRFR